MRCLEMEYRRPFVDAKTECSAISYLRGTKFKFELHIEFHSGGSLDWPVTVMQNIVMLRPCS